MLPEHLKEKLRKFRKSKVRYNLQYYNKTYYLHSFTYFTLYFYNAKNTC